MAESMCLSVEPETVWVEPGEQVLLALMLQHTGDAVRRNRIEVSGIPPDWYDVGTPAVTLSPGTAVRTHLAVHPPAGAAPTARGQPVTVQVTSEDDQTMRASAVVTLTVGTDPGLRLDVVPAEARGRSARFRLTFVNAMDRPALVDLAVGQIAEGLRIHIEPAGPDLLPTGGTLAFTAQVVPTVRPHGHGPHPYDLEFCGLQPGRVEPQATVERAARWQRRVT